MKQLSFADAEYAGKRKQARCEYFLLEMEQIVLLQGLIVLIGPSLGGQPAYQLVSMLRVHLMQNWLGYNDPTMEEALYEMLLLRQFSSTRARSSMPT